MPEPTNTHTLQPQLTITISAADTQAVNRFIEQTDWAQFSSRVAERTSREVDAYEKARVKSLQTAPQHVFM